MKNKILIMLMAAGMILGFSTVSLAQKIIPKNPFERNKALSVSGSISALPLPPNPSSTATFTDINAGLSNVQYSSVAWGDYDNDGYLDILLTGQNMNSVAISKIYHNEPNLSNPSQRIFVERAAPVLLGNGSLAALPGVLSGSVAWGDYDNDGYLDILLTGQKQDTVPISKIYHNEPNPSNPSQRIFVEHATPVLNNGSLAALPGVFYSSVAWGDYDNDGYLDILLTGKTSVGYNPYLCTSKIYHNEPNPSNPSQRIFVEHATPVLLGNGSLALVALPDYDWISVAWGDYDNDGYLDILFGGNPAKIYTNKPNPSNPSQRIFVEHAAPVLLSNGSVTALPVAFKGSVAWGDYDNDGYLDILMTGATGCDPDISKIYHNEPSPPSHKELSSSGQGQRIFVEYVTPVLLGNGSLAALPAVDYSSVAWGDYDNNGYLDILLTGRYANPVPGISKIYTNKPRPSNPSQRVFVERAAPVLLGNGSLAALPGVLYSSVAWGDYDNDGRLDILLTGYCDNGAPFRSIIYRNFGGIANTIPDPPFSGLAASVSGHRVTLSWDPVTDAQTPWKGLSYNLVIGTSPIAMDRLSPMADLSGWRRIPAKGWGVQGIKKTIHNLPDGIYYWSVQAIDAALAGSKFSDRKIFVIE